MTERSIFLDASEIDDPHERAAYLDRACAGDPGLREQVERLLAANDRGGPFLERPAPTSWGPSTSRRSRSGRAR